MHKGNEPPPNPKLLNYLQSVQISSTVETLVLQ